MLSKGPGIGTSCSGSTSRRVGVALAAQRRSIAAGSAVTITIWGSVAGDFHATFDFLEIEFG